MISDTLGISLINGLYSQSGTHGRRAFHNIRSKFRAVKSINDIDGRMRGIFSIGGVSAIEALRKKRKYFDLIIGDPPYGFNEGNARSREIQRLYADFIDVAIDAIAEGGNVIISVPAFARNGKQVPFYQTKDGLIPLVLAAANRKHREIARIANSRPTIWDCRRPSLLLGLCCDDFSECAPLHHSLTNSGTRKGTMNKISGTHSKIVERTNRPKDSQVLLRSSLQDNIRSLCRAVASVGNGRPGTSVNKRRKSAKQF